MFSLIFFTNNLLYKTTYVDLQVRAHIVNWAGSHTGWLSSYSLSYKKPQSNTMYYHGQFKFGHNTTILATTFTTEYPKILPGYKNCTIIFKSIQALCSLNNYQVIVFSLDKLTQQQHKTTTIISNQTLTGPHKKQKQNSVLTLQSK